MASKQDIKTVAARSKLEARREPHWHRVSEGAYLGYRVMTVGKPGSWVARYRDRGTGKQVTKSLGDFSEHPDSKRYDLASAAAVEWFTHLGRGGSVKSYTVADAAKEFVDYSRSEHGETSAKNVQQRVDRLVAPTTLVNVALEDLTPSHLAVAQETGVPAPTLYQMVRKAREKEAAKAADNVTLAAGGSAAINPQDNAILDVLLASIRAASAQLGTQPDHLCDLLKSQLKRC